MRFKAVVNGKEVAIKGRSFIADDSEKGKLYISWPLITVEDTLLFDINEKGMSIKLKGKDQLDWFLDLTDKKDAKLPFKKIDPDEIVCNLHGLDYSLKILKGNFTNGVEKSVFRIEPEDDTIILDLNTTNQ